MRIGKFLLATAAASMAVAPAMAAPTNPAARLSIASSVRTGSTSAHENKAVRGGIIVAVLAAAAVIAGIIIVAHNKDKSDSN